MKGKLQIVASAIASALLTWTITGALENPSMPVVRIAELQIDPAQLAAYTMAVKKEIETSVGTEPGVLAIYAVAEKNDPARFRFFEIYADEAAYKDHIQSPHFRKYFETTRTMILSRRLIETIPVQLSSKPRGPE
jgi:quinol monooxygenase YgiN